MLKRTIKFVLSLGLVVAMFFAATSFYFAQAGGSVTCGAGISPTRQLGLASANWRTYCPPCVAAMRTFGRVEVIDTLEAAASVLAVKLPSTKIVFGEIGWPNGGRFRPHNTHREGLSVDIMVPLKNGREINTTPDNRFGYDVDFDQNGRNADGEIDFDALATMLDLLAVEAGKRGGKVRRVFFAPDLQPFLFSTPAGARLKGTIVFNQKQSWVRHDDHFHVDFAFPCSGTG